MPLDKPQKQLHIAKPSWLKSKIAGGKNYTDIKKNLKEKQLHTVCEEANCPNIGECWDRRSATLMILGDTCTRACRFCLIKTGNPQGVVDQNEPQKMADTVKFLQLKYVVLTMVDRDDLNDGGAAHIVKVIKAINKTTPNTLVELLGGDFNNNQNAIAAIVATKLQVFAHNIETVERLSKKVRDARADYRQSLEVLKYAKKVAKSMFQHKLITKSAIMLGLGETEDDLKQSFADLVAVGVDSLTLGQYLRPSKKHLSINSWVTPQEFDYYAQLAKKAGIKSVASGPLVRSSYKAEEYYNKAFNNSAKQ